MIFDNAQELKERIEATSNRKVRRPVKIFEDSTSYMTIEGGSVLRLGGNDYFILGDTTEGRFGIDDQPKFWVKYAVDLTTGTHKIIKLVFHERFSTNIGPVKVRCTRNPDKESAILDVVRGHARFMQGVTEVDPAGNKVRIVDFIRGLSFYRHLEMVEMSHEAYAEQMLPSVLTELVACIEAMAHLHAHGHQHGDIRNDHILIDAESGLFRWIDFDYDVNFSDYDVWSMGNVLAYAIGCGMHTFHRIRRKPEAYPHLKVALDEDDALMLQKHRVANLGKLFPYLPPGVDELLGRFSYGSNDPYVDLESQVRDIRAVFGLNSSGIAGEE